MSGVNVGVNQLENGEYVWTCGCGTSGAPTKDRDEARESFKQHRRASCTSQDSVRTTPQQAHKEIKVMDALKEKATKAKKTAPKKAAGKERAVTEKEALQVIEKIKADKGTVMGEARRLGCYHATLRKALRAAIGEKAYAQLMSGKKGKKAAPKKAAPKKAAVKKTAKKAAPKKVAAKKAPPRKRAAAPAPAVIHAEESAHAGTPVSAAVETTTASNEAGEQ